MLSVVGLAFDPFPGRSAAGGGRAEAGSWRLRLGRLLQWPRPGQNRPQMPLAKDEHPIGDLGPGALEGGGSACWFAQVRRFCGRCPWLSVRWAAWMPVCTDV